MPRLEDAAFLRGQGRYVDDIRLPGMLHAAFVRSPHAHAAIRGIDKASALAAGGVKAVLTLRDLRPWLKNERLVVVSSIDNLLKGQAGVALQNLNLMLGIEETCGLQRIPLYP